MSRQLTPGSPASRIAAVGLLALVIALLWLLLISPAIDARKALDDELRASRSLRARFQAQATTGPRDRGAGAVLVAPTADVAAAMLQTRLEAIIEDAGGIIERLEAMSLPRRRGSARLDPIGATAAFAATTAQLRQLLLAIETDRTTMIVDELSVRAEPSSPADTQGDAQQEKLRIEITVRAFRPHGAAQ